MRANGAAGRLREGPGARTALAELGERGKTRIHGPRDVETSLVFVRRAVTLCGDSGKSTLKVSA
jgi:hypothetical protein